MRNCLCEQTLRIDIIISIFLPRRDIAGVNLGRPKGYSKKVQRICSESGDIEALLASGATMSSVAKLYKVHRNTLARCRRMHYFEEK